MIRINLLPHRALKRAQRKRDFFVGLGIAAGAGLAISALIVAVVQGKISGQNDLNNILVEENRKLDDQIKEIATLKQEIDALRSRQTAVEDLQADRNQAVYLFDELVKQVPEGVYLTAIKQDTQGVQINGYAQSNERVSELLRNVSNTSAWLEKPELIEIKAAVLGNPQVIKDQKRVFDFSMRVGMQRPRDKEAKETSPAAPSPAPGT